MLRDVLIKALIEPSGRHGSVCESIRSFDRRSRRLGGSAIRSSGEPPPKLFSGYLFDNCHSAIA